ncbi:MAG: hypothetical protein WC335_07850, partial [Candidatus Omnitrophota bacterium]
EPLKKILFLACSNVSGEDAVACAAPTRRKPQLRRTRFALPRSERPSERHCPLNVGAPPRARGILSYFLRDQLYPGIRKQKRQKAGHSLEIAEEVLSGRRFVCQGCGAFIDVSEL